MSGPNWFRLDKRQRSDTVTRTETVVDRLVIYRKRYIQKLIDIVSDIEILKYSHRCT